MSTSEPQSPRMAGEAARTVSDWVAAGIVVLTALVAVLTPFTDVVPGNYRAQFTAIVGGLGAAAAALTKLQGEWTRRNVWSSDSYYEGIDSQARSLQNRQQAKQPAPAPATDVPVIKTGTTVAKPPWDGTAQLAPRLK